MREQVTGYEVVVSRVQEICKRFVSIKDCLPSFTINDDSGGWKMFWSIYHTMRAVSINYLWLGHGVTSEHRCRNDALHWDATVTSYLASPSSPGKGGEKSTNVPFEDISCV